MRANNITMRDSFVTGGDDNVCIKNDTANVLIENVTFLDGHGASIGSIPDCAGCHGIVTNITYRNLTFLGNAPMKIKWWANTTGEISNVLFEDIYLGNASVAIEMMANYGSWACPCKWIHNFGGPGQRGKCHTYGPPFSVGIGGNCGVSNWLLYVSACTFVPATEKSLYFEHRVNLPHESDFVLFLTARG
jgi:hypothetical protein